MFSFLSLFFWGSRLRAKCAAQLFKVARRCATALVFDVLYFTRRVCCNACALILGKVRRQHPFCENGAAASSRRQAQPDGGEVRG